MATVVVMPQLGNSVESCLIVSWQVKVGDEIAENAIVCEVETDKASMEVPSSAAGTVLALLWAEGDDVPVKEPLLVVGAAGEDPKPALDAAGWKGATARPRQPPPPRPPPAAAPEPEAAPQVGAHRRHRRLEPPRPHPRRRQLPRPRRRRRGLRPRRPRHRARRQGRPHLRHHRRRPRRSPRLGRAGHRPRRPRHHRRPRRPGRAGRRGCPRGAPPGERRRRRLPRPVGGHQGQGCPQGHLGPDDELAGHLRAAHLHHHRERPGPARPAQEAEELGPRRWA